MSLPDAIPDFLSHFDPEHHARLAVFDCDGTLIKGDIGEAMLYFQIERFLFRESPARTQPDHPDREEVEQLFNSLIRFPPSLPSQDGRFITLSNHLLSWYFQQLKTGETAKACSDIVRLLAGFTEMELREIAGDVLREELESPMEQRLLGKFSLPRGIRYVAETLELIELLRSNGFDVKVISGSNQWSVEAVCSHPELNFDPKDVIGLELHQEGTTLSPRIFDPVPVREGKVQSLKSRKLPRPSIVVSDSAYDLPLFMHSSGLKVFVQTGEPAESLFNMPTVVRDASWIILDHPALR